MPKGFSSVVGFSLNRDDEVRMTKTFKALEAIPLFADRELEHLGSQAVGRARRNATNMEAVDTGRLRKNIKWTKGVDSVELHSQAIDPKTGRDYASTVHNGLGTGKNAVARPYLGQAYHWMANAFVNRMNRLFGGIPRIANKYVSIGPGNITSTIRGLSNAAKRGFNH